MKTAFYFAIASALTLTACNDFLTRDPLDEITDKAEFWDVESNIRTAVYDEYTTYFPGYRSGWSRADWFSQTNVADWTDDNAQQKQHSSQRLRLQLQAHQVGTSAICASSTCSSIASTIPT